MFDETLKVANKIITTDDLEEIFQLMNDKYEKCIKQYNLEKIQNERLDYSYQKWTLKYFSGSLKFTVYFYDDTSITFDNYCNFISVFRSRIHEIKQIHSYYYISYFDKDSNNNISQHIYMDVYESKMSLDIKLSSSSDLMKEIYEFIKQKILSAPEKYDRVIKSKNSISNKIIFSIGYIPTIIILTLLAFIPIIKKIYDVSYVGFPIICLILSLVNGSIFIGGKINKLYKNILPEKKYSGYDSSKGKSIYKDDIEKFIETSEILIGKNVDNLNNRKEILNIEEKYSKYLKYEFLILLVVSVLVVII